MESTQKPTEITSEEHDQLLRNAKAAKEKAYCPYSHFRVGAAVLTVSGAIIQGCNVENASYPVGLCAERCCLSRAVVEGYGPGDFKALAVSTDVAPPASPCGMCRQFINEFCAPTLPIIMFDSHDDHAVMTVEELLPMGFGPEKLVSRQEAGAQGSKGGGGGGGGGGLEEGGGSKREKEVESVGKATPAFMD